MSERQGIEIDYCPQCRGVWLDRGELDKIIARANEHESRGVTPPHGDPVTHGGTGSRHGQWRDAGEIDDDYRSGKRRKPFWMEIFD
jgi:Zn-finger nucleic acid-binding protein